ncbi:MAG: alpha-galactosidase [Lachnospiraceae bacterium]|nr:alpha-galactosidase [Lachnospiraceae bacterium]
MSIVYHESTGTFHLYNQYISYIMMITENGQPGQLYCGKRIHDKEDFSYLFELAERPMASCVFDRDKVYSMASIRQEYPVYGNGDYRHPAVEILQRNGSRISEFRYEGYQIMPGKPKLPGLPALYAEDDAEAQTLILTMRDALTGIRMELFYTIFEKGGLLARSVRFTNEGAEAVHLTRAMSLCLDLPDCEYDWIQFSGTWSRERTPRVRRLEYGIQAVDSMRGNSSHEQNPFVILKRPTADEFQGEVFGFSFIYSGNFQIQAEVDAYRVTRLLVGLHPERFDWKLDVGETFQTPEAVVVYSDRGLNDMSQTFHAFYQKRLARGYWRDRERPILINNWEATYYDFDEDKLAVIASKAKECGVELFVLDDGWFGARRDDRAGLGDWVAAKELLPNGITGVADRIESLGMKFGLWIEPEMVNADSDLYRAHPDWVLAAPGRSMTHGRYQYVLDFSRKEVVDHIYDMIARILREAKVSYIKWDMNRCITECFSGAYPADRQGEIFHRYILGVYDLYERLTGAFPLVLFESCASGGARFDPGMLYYAPQCWTSDDSDAIERLKIQYGTSMCYPVSSMGAHVSVVPNHQVHRMTPLHTRANVAFFGTFGYELDLNRLPEDEIAQVKEQIAFMKVWRHLLQFGIFYRLKSPFEGNEAAWMVVSPDKKTAIVGWYRILNTVNNSFSRVRLCGLNADYCYHNSLSGVDAYGDELMYLGMQTTDESAGVRSEDTDLMRSMDFDSRIYVLTACAQE